MDSYPFWKQKPLGDLTSAEWESLCSKCGICCLNRLTDRKTGKVFFTKIACRFLDLDRCTCTVYAKPFFSIPECDKITPDNIGKLKWLPKTCGYRCAAEGRDLEWWHPLISGQSATVHQAGISVRNRVVSERSIPLNEFKSYIMDRPNTIP